MKSVRKGKVSFLMLPIIRGIKEKKVACDDLTVNWKRSYSSEDGCIGISKMEDYTGIQDVVDYLERVLT